MKVCFSGTKVRQRSVGSVFPDHGDSLFQGGFIEGAHAVSHQISIGVQKERGGERRDSIGLDGILSGIKIDWEGKTLFFYIGLTGF